MSASQKLGLYKYVCASVKVGVKSGAATLGQFPKNLFSFLCYFCSPHCYKCIATTAQMSQFKSALGCIVDSLNLSQQKNAYSVFQKLSLLEQRAACGIRRLPISVFLLLRVLAPGFISPCDLCSYKKLLANVCRRDVIFICVCKYVAVCIISPNC